MRLSSLLLLSSIFSVSFCDETTVQITSASELISFSNNVNKETDYNGTTVLLVVDLDFSGLSSKFNSIGNSTSRNFRGIFDGQGHTISNLVISSSAQFVGVFGYSSNVTIQNVVIDSTCSFTSSYSSGVPSIGSIIGYSPASKGPCVTTNIVNMANVTFKGETSTKLYIGGIIGGLRSSIYSNIIRNCVNYGTVTHSGTCKDNLVYIGGIAGYINRASPSSSSSLLILLSILPPISPSSSASYDYIQNCANYGTIIHSGASTGTLYIGGITGLGNNSSIENCVSSGVISTNQDSDYIGTIIGHVSSTTPINYCYWTSDVGYSSVYGYKEPITAPLNGELASLDQTTVDELNEYASKNDTWSKWFVVHLNGGSINNITQESLVEIQGHFPDPVKEGNTFLFWCKDAECNEVFDPKKDNTTKITDIYAKWDTSTTITNYVVTFDFGNGTTVNATFTYGSSIVYPVISEREGYTLYWGNYHESMPANNITITAQWTPNNYTVSFDFGNGTTVNVTFSYSTFIDYPKNIIKEGYTFNGWDNYHEYMPAEDITVTVLWKENPTQYVEIVFGTKDLTEEEINDIVRKYVNEGDFTIIKVEGGGDGDGTRVIIKFNDAEKAENFVEVIKESSDTKNVGFITEDIMSFAITYCPMVLLSILCGCKKWLYY